MSQISRKACILSSVHPAFDDRIFHRQAKTLVQAGYTVTLIAQHEKEEVVDGTRIIALPKPKNRFSRIFGLTWRTFRLSILQRAEIYHFHDPELLPIGVPLKLFMRAKVIYDVHEDVPEQILTKHWIPKVLRPSIAKVFNSVEKISARFMDAIIVATEGIAEKFRGLNPIVVHNYPDLQMLPNPSTLRKKSQAKVLVYIGGISKIRGAVEMIRALEYLNPELNVHLELMGGFDPPILEKELQKLPGYRWAQFLGFIKPPEVYERLRGADIGLVCLHPEPRFILAWPVKLFEYMASGLPVVASNFPLWKQIVEGNKCGICVNPLEPKEIAGAIEYLLTHPEEAEIMGENGRRAVVEKYNWNQESRKLLELYKALTQHQI